MVPAFFFGHRDDLGDFVIDSILSDEDLAGRTPIPVYLQYAYQSAALCSPADALDFTIIARTLWHGPQHITGRYSDRQGVDVRRTELWLWGQQDLPAVLFCRLALP